jgi:hypothetical protein
MVIKLVQSKSYFDTLKQWATRNGIPHHNHTTKELIEMRQNSKEEVVNQNTIPTLEEMIDYLRFGRWQKR